MIGRGGDAGRKRVDAGKQHMVGGEPNDRFGTAAEIRMEAEASGHDFGRAVDQDQRDRAAPGAETNALPRAVSPGPGAGAVIIVDQDAFVLGLALEGPRSLPGEAVEAVRLER